MISIYIKKKICSKINISNLNIIYKSIYNILIKKI